MPCSPEKFNRRFGGTSPLSSGSRSKPSKKPAWSRQQAEQTASVRPFLYILANVHQYIKASDTVDPWPDFVTYTRWFPGVARVYRGLSSWTLLKLSVAFLLQPRDQLLPSIYPWLRNRCLDISNSSLLVSADMSHVPVAWQGPCWNIFLRVFRLFGQNTTFLPSYARARDVAKIMCAEQK
jgi:hypothetical protein